VNQFYTCEDIAKRYGVKIKTVYNWIKEKKLPAIRPGKSYAIRPEDINAFELSRMTIQPPTS
jgi:excisionase family DNA binding protein